MKNIAIFGSGSGTNAENIIRFYQNNDEVKVGLLVTNTEKSRFQEIAQTNNISFKLFQNEDFTSNSDEILSVLSKYKVDWIILAGFLRKIHPDIIAAFSDKIINIHPSLLPNYGGKGMYGMKVHEAVFENKDHESGITVHLVNENFDEGMVLEQKSVDVSSCKNPDEIRQKVQELEQLYFPEIINKTL
jgi:phosphoribosylglycinamide formyltransferase-1